MNDTIFSHQSGPRKDEEERALTDVKKEVKYMTDSYTQKELTYLTYPKKDSVAKSGISERGICFPSLSK